MSKLTFFLPSHEQLPSFHVSEDLLQPLLDELKQHEIEIWETPEHLQTVAGEESEVLTEVRIKPGTSEDGLQKFAEAFKHRHGA